MTLPPLEQCTIHFFRVSSTDRVGNQATDDNGGDYYYFETFGNFGQGPQSCHAGKARLDRGVCSCADTVRVEVSDMDLNLDPESIETAPLWVTSGSEPGGEWVVVTETAANSSRLSGTVPTGAGPSAPIPETPVQLVDEDTLTVSYHDLDDGVGNSRWSYSSATADCAGPSIRDLAIDTITDARATVRFTTSEPADRVVEWGTTPALGESVSGEALVTSHAVTLTEFTSREQVFVRVRARDTYGHETVADSLGAPHAFYLGTIPGLYWKESLEGAVSGWTLGGEWQVAVPEGRGASGGGRADPVAAYNNSRVLGHDLSGLGPHSGDYEAGRLEKARSPALDATFWQNTKLLLARQLNNGPGDVVRPRLASRRQALRVARVMVKVGRIGRSLRLERRRDHLQGWEPPRLRAVPHLRRDAFVRRCQLGDRQRRLRRLGRHRPLERGRDGPPEGGVLHYLVRAENDEACSSGPDNGGATDANAHFVPVTNTAARPLPGPIDDLAL